MFRSMFAAGIALIVASSFIDAGPLRNFLNNRHDAREARFNARHGFVPQAVPMYYESQAIPQQLPVGPAEDPLAEKNKDATKTAPAAPAVSKIFLRNNQLPPPAPIGSYWKKLGCTPLGCEWQLERSTKGSAVECDGCQCGCQDGGPCLCGRK